MAKPSRLTLLLPDFAAVFANQLNYASLPAGFRQVLKKGRFHADKHGYHHHLFALFSGKTLRETDLPVARLRGGSTDSLCADPCYLHPDRDKLLMFYRDLDINLEEARAIADRVQPLLDEFNARLEVIQPHEWILELDSAPQVSFASKEGLNGLPVTDFLPRGPDAQRWLRLWNEIQMQLFDCEENLVREQAGKMPINSLWFWGRGALPSWQSWPHVSGTETSLAKLAADSESSYYADAQFSDINSRAALHVQAFDVQGDWDLQLAQLHAQWLAPALSSLKKWQLRELEIIVPEWGVYRLNSLSSWWFWR